MDVRTECRRLRKVALSSRIARLRHRARRMRPSRVSARFEHTCPSRHRPVRLSRPRADYRRAVPHNGLPLLRPANQFPPVEGMPPGGEGNVAFSSRPRVADGSARGEILRYDSRTRRSEPMMSADFSQRVGQSRQLFTRCSSSARPAERRGGEKARSAPRALLFSVINFTATRQQRDPRWRFFP